jgi:hypothetical protein
MRAISNKKSELKTSVSETRFVSTVRIDIRNDRELPMCITQSVTAVMYFFLIGVLGKSRAK